MNSSSFSGILFLLPQFNAFILILSRILGIFLFSPLFYDSAFTLPMRSLFSFFLACLLFVALKIPLQEPTLLQIAFELLIGFFMGFILSLFLEGLRIAGEVLRQMSDLPPLSSWNGLEGWIFFGGCFLLLAADLHLPLLSLLAKSFTWIPSISFITSIEMGSFFAASSKAFLIPLFILVFQVLFLLVTSRALPSYWLNLFRPMQVLTFFLASLLFLQQLVHHSSTLLTLFDTQFTAALP